MTPGGLMLAGYEWWLLQLAFRLGRLPGPVGWLFSSRDIRLLRSAPSVAVLGADSLDPADLVEAGRRLLRTWALLSGLGWATHPVSIAVDRPETAPRVAELSGIAVPAAVFRIGRPRRGAIRSNRRPLDEVLQTARPSRRSARRRRAIGQTAVPGVGGRLLGRGVRVRSPPAMGPRDRCLRRLPAVLADPVPHRPRLRLRPGHLRAGGQPLRPPPGAGHRDQAGDQRHGRPLQPSPGLARPVLSARPTPGDAAGGAGRAGRRLRRAGDPGCPFDHRPAGWPTRGSRLRRLVRAAEPDRFRLPRGRSGRTAAGLRPRGLSSTGAGPERPCDRSAGVRQGGPRADRRALRLGVGGTRPAPAGCPARRVGCGVVRAGHWGDCAGAQPERDLPLPAVAQGQGRTASDAGTPADPGRDRRPLAPGVVARR